jgi:hypothetical protein
MAAEARRSMADGMTWRDGLGCVWGVVVFSALLAAPGYCLALGTDLLGFRRRGVGERLAWGVALSFGTMTLVAVYLAKYLTGMNSAMRVGWLGCVCAGYMAGQLWRERAWRGGGGRWVWGVGAAWVLFVVAELVDVGAGNRLYLSVTIYDHALRTAFVDAVVRTGVPPANPLYWPGHGVAMRYYYFWYVLVAAVVRLGGMTARQAMIASSAWAGFGLAAVTYLFGRNFGLGLGGGLGGAGRWRRPAVAVGLLAVTGLDMLPAVAKAIFRLPADGDMEWWSNDQVASWMDTVLWVPHHAAGLVCCLLGFLLVWMAKDAGRGQRVLCAVIAGVCFASAFGLSTWVAMAFALVMMVWVVWVVGSGDEGRVRARVLLGAGLVAAVALMPYLAELRGAGPGGAENLLRFGVRHPIDPEVLSGVPGFAGLARTHPRLEDALAGLVLLLPGYFVEFGFFGGVLVAAVRRARRGALDEAEKTGLVLAGAALVVTTVLRSAVVANNDFGYRSALIAQFFVLMLAVGWLEEWTGGARRGWRPAMYAMLWIGVAGTVYQAGMLRLYLPVQQALGRENVAGLEQRAMALRNGLEAMDMRIPREAVVQFDLSGGDEFLSYVRLMGVRRQVSVAVPGCDLAFGGDQAPCAGMQGNVERLFGFHVVSPPRGLAAAVFARREGPGLRAEEARVECRRLGAGYLIATRWNAVWRDRRDWVWTLPAVVATDEVRVLDCGAAMR